MSNLHTFFIISTAMLREKTEGISQPKALLWAKGECATDNFVYVNAYKTAKPLNTFSTISQIFYVGIVTQLIFHCQSIFANLSIKNKCDMMKPGKNPLYSVFITRRAQSAHCKRIQAAFHYVCRLPALFLLPTRFPPALFLVWQPAKVAKHEYYGLPRLRYRLCILTYKGAARCSPLPPGIRLWNMWYSNTGMPMLSKHLKYLMKAFSLCSPALFPLSTSPCRKTDGC